MEKIRLNDGHSIPTIGFGVFLIPNDGSTYQAVKEALQAGYRHIDTAAAYFNEQEVGKAIQDSGIPREEIFITSKLWIQDYGYDNAKKGIALSLQKLGVSYIDLYLLHQPYGDVEGAWRALEDAKAEGKIKSIGVSNMTPTLWNKYIPHFKTMPAVNQVECNPYFQQKELRNILDACHVKLEAWGPLGQGNPKLLTDPILIDIANRYQKNVGQIILRFELQEGFIVLPKSTHPKRIHSNLDIYDFELTQDEMNQIRTLDTGKGQHDPDASGVGEYLFTHFNVHQNE